MGWRNIAFTCMDEAERKIKEARVSLNDRQEPLETFVTLLLEVQESLNHALLECVNDGVNKLIKPPTDDCTCAAIQEKDSKRHFRECPLR